MSMKIVHRTRDGKEMPIASMDDQHLVNMINMVYQRAVIIKNSRKSTDPFKAALYGMRTISDEDAANIINEMLEDMAPYFIEAYLRNLSEPRTMLITLFDRDKRLEGFDNVPMLGPGDVPFEIDLDCIDPDEGDR
jgi:hypothetical protein